MPTEPAGPVVLTEGADVRVFDSIEGLVAHVEAIDVRDGVFQAFDATGHSVRLAAKTDRGPVTYSVGTTADPEFLERVLRRAAKSVPKGRLGLTMGQLDSATLGELLIALVPKPRPRVRRRWLRW